MEHRASDPTMTHYFQTLGRLMSADTALLKSRAAICRCQAVYVSLSFYKTKPKRCKFIDTDTSKLRTPKP